MTVHGRRPQPKPAPLNRSTIRTGASTGALFAGLDEAVQQALFDAGTIRQFPAGTVVVHQGDAASHLTQICIGLAKVTQLSSNGAQTTLRFIGPGELIGCASVFQNAAFSSTVTASQETTGLSWSAAQIGELIQHHPLIAVNALKTLGAQAKTLADRVVDMTHKDVEQRIAGAVMRLAGQTGRRCDAGIRLDWPITRQDIGELAGATYFTVSRMLSDWQKQGIVRNGREQILIVLPHRLARIAG